MEAGLAAANELDDTTELYPMLADAQETVIRKIAAHGGYKALYNAPSAMSSADGGYTWTFGAHPTLASSFIMPLGWVQISPRSTAFVGDLFNGWVEGREYLGEGDRIRIAGARNWTGSLYARFVTTPPRLSATQEPILRMIEARELIPIQSVWDWALQGNVNPALASAMEKKWNAKFPIHMLSIKKAFRGGGGLLDPARWYLNSDLGRGSGFSA